MTLRILIDVPWAFEADLRQSLLGRSLHFSTAMKSRTLDDDLFNFWYVLVAYKYTYQFRMNLLCYV